MQRIDSICDNEKTVSPTLLFVVSQTTETHFLFVCFFPPLLIAGVQIFFGRRFRQEQQQLEDGPGNASEAPALFTSANSREGGTAAPATSRGFFSFSPQLGRVGRSLADLNSSNYTRE